MGLIKNLGINLGLRGEGGCHEMVKRVSDDTLNLMALRYGAPSGHMTLESFISLILRLDCMFSESAEASGPDQWIYVSMYT
uniref:Uncharacterized protein n=1 Tax=Poecilia reticulata TaxID=8081 RepID=A0A3P9NGC2_POERE